MKAIFEHVRATGAWQPAPVKGMYGGVAFTHEDFSAFVETKTTQLDAQPDISDGWFKTKILLLQEGGTEFVLRMMDGQGIEYALFTRVEFERKFPDQASHLQ